ncbi:unnamed protein product [Cunninghamella echinulata]
MFQNRKIEKYINTTDCLLLDGGYPLYINNLIESINSRGFDINIKSFIYPFRKIKNKELTDNQEEFNKEINSLRSDIESFFAEFTKLFLRFNKQNVISVTEKEIYNGQMKLASIFYNFKNTIKIYDIKFENEHYYSYWKEYGFDFKRKNENLEFVLEPEFNIKQDNINNKIKYQEDIISKLIYKKLKKIVDHKKIKNKYKYLIKWVGYEEESWEIEDNILQKECIIEYWNDINNL